MPKIYLDVYGLHILIEGTFSEAIDWVRRDFEFFEVDACPAVHCLVEIHCQEPNFDLIPDIPATAATPRNVVYCNGRVHYLDYRGRALTIYDTKARHFKIFSRERDLTYEATYLFLLSTIGAWLDRRHRHRIHAVGVAIDGRAVLVVMPMSGGKSTLCHNLLACPQVKLLSDDSPFIDWHGNIYPFPLHLGLLPDSPLIPNNDKVRRVNRMEFGSKILIDYSCFRDRVAGISRPGLLCIGVRIPGRQARYHKISKLAALRALMPACVVGIGLFQGIEFIATRGLRDVIGRFPVALSRLRAAVVITRLSETYRLELGRDFERNTDLVLQLARDRLSVKFHSAGRSQVVDW